MATWPANFLFVADGLHTHFQNAHDFQNWQNAERVSWSNIIVNSGGFNGPMNANLNHLVAVSAESTDADLNSFAGRYRPSNGLAANFIKKIRNPTVRGIVFGEITQPGAAANQAGGDFIEGRAIATIYLALGSAIQIERGLEKINGLDETVTKANQAFGEIQRIRESEAELLKRFEAQIKRVDEDWETKVKGFVAEVALSAPRTFWDKRSETHTKLASSARVWWNVSLVGVVTILVAAAVGANRYLATGGDLSAVAVQLVERFVIFGTILGLGVWWLRQKLRELRMHEHLAEDAAERATMIETYAALRGAGLQPNDLTPILAALYRSAVGSLGDDSGPNLPLEIILKTMGDAASRLKQ